MRGLLLWLAVNFQVASEATCCGSEASRADASHIVFLLAVAARTRATSAGVTNEALLPNALRTYDATLATHSSLF